MKRFLFILWQFTWGLPQNIAGLIGYLQNRKLGAKQEKFGHGILTHVQTDKNFGGVSLGMFIFVNGKRQDDWFHDSSIHEYGHSIQSLILGPLYFVLVGLPSILWCNLKPIIKWRKETGHSYYWLYCEGWANVLGKKALKAQFRTKEMLTRGYYDKPFPKGK